MEDGQCINDYNEERYTINQSPQFYDVRSKHNNSNIMKSDIMESYLNRNPFTVGGTAQGKSNINHRNTAQYQIPPLKKKLENPVFCTKLNEYLCNEAGMDDMRRNKTAVSQTPTNMGSST